MRVKCEGCLRSMSKDEVAIGGGFVRTTFVCKGCLNRVTVFTAGGIDYSKDKAKRTKKKL